MIKLIITEQKLEDLIIQMIDSVVLHDACAVHKLKCVSSMYVRNNNVCVPFFSLVLNNMIHGHFTRSSAHVNINIVSTLDYRNSANHYT